MINNKFKSELKTKIVFLNYLLFSVLNSCLVLSTERVVWGMAQYWIPGGLNYSLSCHQQADLENFCHILNRDDNSSC